MKTGIIIDLFYDNGWCLSCKFTMKMKFASIYAEKYPQIGIKYILLNINTKHIRQPCIIQKKINESGFCVFMMMHWPVCGHTNKKMLLPHYRFQVYAFKYYRMLCTRLLCTLRSPHLCMLLRSSARFTTEQVERKRQIVPIYPDIYLPFLFTHWLEENK